MFKILSEPSGELYERMIDFAGKKCSSFSLVWRGDLRFEESADGIHQKLQKFGQSETHSDSWPCTEIKSAEDDKPNLVRVYEVTPETVSILKKAPGQYAAPERESRASWRIRKDRIPGLHSWISPALPEDLAFYLSSGQWWMCSIAHEEEAYINSSSLTEEEINKAVPSLRILPCKW